MEPRHQSSLQPPPGVPQLRSSGVLAESALGSGGRRQLAAQTCPPGGPLRVVTAAAEPRMGSPSGAGSHYLVPSGEDLYRGLTPAASCHVLGRGGMGHRMCPTHEPAGAAQGHREVSATGRPSRGDRRGWGAPLPGDTLCAPSWNSPAAWTATEGPPDGGPRPSATTQMRWFRDPAPSLDALRSYLEDRCQRRHA